MTQAMLDVARVLTPEQRAKIGERMQERAGAHGRPDAAHAARAPGEPIIGRARSDRRVARAGARRSPLTTMTPRLLLIDDDARLSSMVGDYLRSAGFEVEAAGSLAAGRERLAAEAFDALVLDLMLPDGDGLDLCRELRGRAARATCRC